VRVLSDFGEDNQISDYSLNILRAISWLQIGQKVVICCSTGQSRSNAIALGVLVKFYRMHFYDAWNLVKEKVPISDIDSSHIAKLKELFKI
jgi:protein-tyrosine phosphatase